MSRARRLPRSVNQSPPCLSNTRSFGPFSGCSPHLSTTVSTLPVDMSTRWIEPPIYSAGDGGPGIRKPRPGTQLKPPLLQTYILPSGPSAAPFGPPGISATTAPVRPDPRQPPAADFDQHHRPVRHDHRAFRKLQIGGDNANIPHEILPACFGCRRISSLDPARATCRCV